MNEQLFVLNSQKKTTNHILHLLLCIPTLGLWVIPWLFITDSNKRHNARLQAKMNSVMEFKMQGMDDAQVYRQIKSDDADRKLRSDRAFVIIVVAVTIALFYMLKK